MKKGLLVLVLIAVVLVGPIVYWYLNLYGFFTEKPPNLYYCEKDKDCVATDKYSAFTECVNKEHAPGRMPGDLGVYCTCNSLEKRCERVSGQAPEY